MAKAEKFSCPHCGMRYNTQPNLAGQKAKCKGCRNVFTIPGTSSNQGNLQPASLVQELNHASNLTPKSIPEARIIIDASPAPQPRSSGNAGKITTTPHAAPNVKPTFLEPIDEPSVNDTYHLSPHEEDLFAGPALGDLTGGTKLNPAQFAKTSKVASVPNGSQGFLSYLASRPLACILFLTNFIPIYCISISILSPYRWLDTAVSFFVVYVGLRADRGETINGLLIKVFMWLLIGSSLIASFAGGVNSYSGALTRLTGPSAYKIAILIGITFFVIFFVIMLGLSGLYYLFLRLFGFFRTTASLYTFSNLMAILLLVLMSVKTSLPVENKDTAQKPANPLSQYKTPPPLSDPVWNEENHQVETHVFDEESNAPVSDDTTVENQDPFEMTDSSENDENPFETVETPETKENPFEVVDPKPESDNPFVTTDDNPFEDSAANVSSEEKEEEEPAAVSVLDAGIGTVPLDEILKQLNNAPTNSVKRLLKAISRHEPIDAKREAVCRAMVTLLQNDRLTFVTSDIVDILVAWQTPSVSDDLVQIINNSTDFSKFDTVKQLARVPDDKVAVAVVELWTKKPLFLKEAIPPLDARAEEPLWKVLDSSDAQLQIDACNFLANQGTARSIRKLATLSENPNRSVADAAQKATATLMKKGQ